MTAFFGRPPTSDCGIADVGCSGENQGVRIVVGTDGAGLVSLVDPDRGGEVLATSDRLDLAALVHRYEPQRPRWVWIDTREFLPQLLAAGVRVERCHDLRLCGAILANSTRAAVATERLGDRPDWLPHGPNEGVAVEAAAPVPAAVDGPALFDLDDTPAPRPNRDPSWNGPADAAPPTLAAIVAEHDRQLAVVRDSETPAALRLLLAAESAGALIGAELQAAGLPWNRAVHEGVLEAELGPRPPVGRKPARMEELAATVRAELAAPALNLDSQVDLLRALQRVGLPVTSTSRWELREHEHPAIEPVVAYKKLARLLGANGWAWIEEWVADGRFRPDYVPGGTATGRWATSGGGALQLPKNVRAAVTADPGWRLVVADAAQLEPRVLAGMSHDTAMAEAARGRDLYGGIVDARVVETRSQAKIAMLGAMYGATTGESGRLVPRLARAYPKAMALVDAAAREGERGRSVTTLLGRSSPRPGPAWHEVQSRASQPDATAADERRARSTARDWGRFTRNFVVQGSAAEWALCWMAALRARLTAIGDTAPARHAAAASGPAFDRVPHLVYFLHDELIVHTPAEHADAVAAAVLDTAKAAGELLFGDFPVDFPLDLAIVDSYAAADA
ncbi:bifunctional 3'-5' exonuclease/DNA polymerase [Agromyces tardus]|uniref:DNA-directed DNA polymerase n=1 Tax=Agromyces tardus TaxID=2583849 RepID=A0A3M8AHR8_9MICO|nr:bifunctional 3'-5' exonuclease/DNA polymerase [Agromyces tardus]RNB50766.1 bifunctional 3'-5' exonuclease/DNA polymerase [Agromyces tardus]